jgi:hypothetical protein
MWLPRMDLNHDKVIQSHLCYRYTTRQVSNLKDICTVRFFNRQGSFTGEGRSEG